MISSINQNKKQCPFCDYRKINLYSRNLSIHRCSSCGLLFRSINKPQSELNQLYNSAWLDAANHIDETGGTDLKLARVYSQKLRQSLGLKNLAGLKILDFGSGRGGMLVALAELGADVYGIDPFGYAYLKGKGFKVFRDIQEVPKELLFDGIITIDVIEHLDCPWKAIQDLYGHLASPGWFYITTLNVNSLNARLFRSQWREFYNASHINFFSAGCLKRIFNKLNLVKYNRLRWFIKYTDNPLQNIMHYILQFLQLDGELRYILFK